MSKILIVDDDEQLRKLLRLMLGIAGYEVSEASDGREALAQHRRCPVDLVITDIFMPEKEGLETIREMVQSGPKPKIIAMSGQFSSDQEGWLGVAKQLGADSSLAKPFEMTQVLTAVSQALNAT